jgi:GNAT superfamily N-acetyltransferase
VRRLGDADRPWVAGFMRAAWGSESVVSRGRLHRTGALPGFVAEDERRPVGVATYAIESSECELVTLNSLVEGRGAGSALIGAVAAEARAGGCSRLWLVTTNDNLHALGFYQRRGFVLVALRPRAVERARALKPEIPAVGLGGIPLRDEIELEIAL